jgi:carbonic anhydrase
MRESDKLLLNNKSWVQEIGDVDPNYFSRLANQQIPEFLWIGCSDSRVPANTITGTDPGQIFVHRNIANLVIPDDVNMLSVLQYAVEVLKVKHVIVCGHLGCGGVKASLTDHGLAWPIAHWLSHLGEVQSLHREELAQTPEPDRADVLCKLSVRHQVHKLSKLSIIQKAWQEREGPELHGWVFSLGDGVLHELITLTPGDSAKR